MTEQREQRPLFADRLPWFSLQVSKSQALTVQGVVTGQPCVVAVAGAAGVLSFDGHGARWKRQWDDSNVAWDSL